MTGHLPFHLYHKELTIPETTSEAALIEGEYSVGDIGPAGGLFFCVNPDYETDGWLYLESAPGDQSRSLEWCNCNGNFESYMMNADGSNQTRLTNNTADDRNPTWSADGQKIVFTSNRDGHEEIYVMNTNGSNQTRLANNEAGDGYPCV